MDTATKERYIKQLNYASRMKIKEAIEKQNAFQKEKEKAFQMIPKRPIPFEIKTEDNNDEEDYLRMDNYINVWPALETASYKTQKLRENITSFSKGKKSAKNITEMETAVSAKGISINLMPTDNIYDGDRGNNNDHNSHKKNIFHHVYDNNFTGGGPKQNSFQMWRLNWIAAQNIYEKEEETGIDAMGVSIGKQAELPKTSKVGRFKSKIKQEVEPSTISKHITILPRIYERVIETGINMTGVAISDQPKLPKTSNVKAIRSKVKSKYILIGAIICMAVMMAIAGSAFMVYNVALKDTDTSSKNATITDYDIMTTDDENMTIIGKTVVTNVDTMTTDDDTVTKNDDTVTTDVDTVRTDDDTVSTDDDGVTTDYETVTNDDTVTADTVRVTTKCFKSKANCKTSIVENKTADRIGTGLNRAVRDGSVTQVCDFLKCGASVNYHDHKRETPLLIAAHEGHVDVVQLLLTYNASVDQYNIYGTTPLYKAASRGHADVVKLLLAHNASVDSADVMKNTPLSEAVRYGNVEITQLLLAYNASVDKTVSDNLTPLMIAVQNRNVKITQLLLTYNASVDKSVDGETPLYIAKYYKDEAIIQLLLKYNASVDKT